MDTPAITHSHYGSVKLLKNSVGCGIVHPNGDGNPAQPQSVTQMKNIKSFKAVKFTVGEMQLDVHCPFVAGHTLSEIEASVLNQTYRENVRNGSKKKVVECGNDSTKAQKVILEFEETYEFGLRRSSATSPYDKALKKAAEVAVKSALNNKGISLDDYGKDKFATAVANAQKNPAVIKQAELQADLAKQSLQIAANPADLNAKI